jgi:hypothetical protein
VGKLYADSPANADPPANADSQERQFAGNKGENSGIKSVQPIVAEDASKNDEPLDESEDECLDDILPIGLLRLLPLKENIKLVDPQRGKQCLVCSLNNVLQNARITSDMVSANSAGDRTENFTAGDLLAVVNKVLVQLALSTCIICVNGLLVGFVVCFPRHQSCQVTMSQVGGRLDSRECGKILTELTMVPAPCV